MNRRISFIVAAAAVAIMAWRWHDRADAHSYFVSGGVPVIWPGNQSIRYLSPSTFPPDSEPDLRYREAMAAWSIVPKADFTYYFIRNDQDYTLDNYDGFNDTGAVPAGDLDPGVLGVTFLVSNGSYWYDMDMVFSDLPDNVGYDFDPNPTCAIVTNPTPLNGYSFLLVAIHELGHALGLGHDPIGNEPSGKPWSIATMNPRYPSGGTLGQENIVELHTDDRNGCRFLYPHSGPAQPPHVDLATAGYSSSSLPGYAVPVKFTPSSATPGGSITVRSVIENLGSTTQFNVRQGFYLSTNPLIQPSDVYLGSLLWDMAFEDAFEFNAAVDLPDDIAAGTYYVGTILDDLGQVVEVYEDNNAASYCGPLTINRLAPVVSILGQQNISCGSPYSGPAASVTKPLNMAPITWSIDNPPAGMSIHPTSGVISWPSPISSAFAYVLIVRATSPAGTDTEFFFLGVGPAAPQIAPISDASICRGSYTGPTPQITAPACMNPIINWSLDSGPPGMTINNATGVVSWPIPVPSGSPYAITIRATNGAGNGTQAWQLRVSTSDIDGNSIVDATDVSAFSGVLVGTDANPAHAWRCDQNFDGAVNGLDVRAFANCYLGP